jgi:hypothetical protein
MHTALRSRLTRRALIAALAALALAAAPAGAMTLRYLFTDQVDENDVNAHTIAATARVVVRGDGDTDLDCYLYRNGRLVSSDTDETDICVLSTRGQSGQFRLYVRNIGDVYNEYRVSAE